MSSKKKNTKKQKQKNKEEGGMLVLAPEEEVSIVRQKIVKEGFVLINADSEVMNLFEYNIYPPGTPENKNFELLIIPVENYQDARFSVIGLGFAKPCKKLDDLIKGDSAKCVILDIGRAIDGSDDSSMVCQTHEVKDINRRAVLANKYIDEMYIPWMCERRKLPENEQP